MGNKKKKKKDYSSGEDHPVVKKNTLDAANPSATMNVDSDDNDDILDEQRPRSISTISNDSRKAMTPEEAQEGWTSPDGFRQPGKGEMERIIKAKSHETDLLQQARNFVCPFERGYEFLLQRIEDVSLIPPRGLGGIPNRIYIHLHLHPAWAEEAEEAINVELGNYLSILKKNTEEAEDPIQDPYIQHGEENKIWISAKYCEDSGYAIAAFVYFICSRICKLYIHRMGKKGFVNLSEKRTYGTWEKKAEEIKPTVSPIPSTSSQAAEVANKPPTKMNTTTAATSNTTTAGTTTTSTVIDTTTTAALATTTSQPTATTNKADGEGQDAPPTPPPAAHTSIRNEQQNTALCEQLKRAEEMVKQHQRSWGERMDRRDADADPDAEMADLHAEEEEELFTTSNTCLCDIGRIRQPINYDRLLCDMAKQFPGEWNHFSGYGHRNRRRTLELAFTSKAAVQSIATKGLNTHGLHLDFTMEVPGLVMVSLDNIPTEMPMGDVTKVMERYGEVYGEPYIARKTFGGKSCTIGTRVYGIIMKRDNPLPPVFKVRGHEVTSKYTGMEERTFPIDHGPVNRQRPRSASRSRSRRNSGASAKNISTMINQAATGGQPQSSHGSSKEGGFQRQKSSTKCFQCHNLGHRAAECPQNDGGPSTTYGGGRRPNDFGRRQRSGRAWTQSQEAELQEKRERYSAKLKDGTEIQSFLHPEFQPAKFTTHRHQRTARHLDIITNRLLQSQSDNTFNIGEYTDTLSSSPRQGPPGTAKVDGKVRQVFSVPLNLYLAFALLETGTFFHVRPFLTEENETFLKAFSGYMQFGPLGNVNPMTLDPKIYTVAVKDHWAKMDFGEDVDVEAEVVGLGNLSFKGVYVDLTHIPEQEL